MRNYQKKKICGEKQNTFYDHADGGGCAVYWRGSATAR
jgi:hypothetical protein